MICPTCGGDTFRLVYDVGLKCQNCGYFYSIERKKWINIPLFFNIFVYSLRGSFNNYWRWGKNETL